MELEEAIEVVNRIRIDFFDNKYREIHTDDEVAEKYDALGTILRYAKNNSIPKEKVKEGIESIEDYFDRLNGPDEDIEYIRNIKQELLEELN